MTKFYGMPGLRMGYILSENKDFIDKLYSIKEPWTVNFLAEKITIEVLKSEEESKYRFGIDTRPIKMRGTTFLLVLLKSRV